jgi:beta-mannosidase
VSLAAPDPLASLRVRTRVVGNDGIVAVTAMGTKATDGCELRIGDVHAALRHETELVVPDAALWWPHTHGDPALHTLEILAGGELLARRRIGFRALGWADDIARDGLDLQVNGVPVWVRGAVWTPADLVSMAPGEAQLRALLERVRDAGMNMVRVVGTGAYETPRFFDLCDELGILVWQDLMFGNLDYPVSDPEFRAGVLREAADVLDAVAGRASLAVVCGNNEVEQQPAMMGLDPELGRDSLWDEDLAALVDGAGAGCAYVRSTPCGGALPFHANAGVTHYFGVSGYFEPPAAARRADVRFASECLAFANVPDEVDVPVHHPDWKAGVPRDAGTGWDLGAGWDFDDVRDYYLGFLYGVDPVALRRSDLMRYLELSRHASGEVMAEVMGEWRRDASPCRGALVLWLKDMLAGAGLGVLDHRGTPKVAYHYLRRALAPVAVWMTDEEVNGVDLHVANDRPGELEARLRVALYRDGAARVAEAEIELRLAGHETRRLSVEQLVGTFVDAAWAYRFGPPAQHAIVATLLRGDDAPEVVSQAFCFPAGRPTERRPGAELGVRVIAAEDSVRIESDRLVYGARLTTPGFEAGDDAFSVEPGAGRTVTLRRVDPEAQPSAVLTAINLSDQVRAA